MCSLNTDDFDTIQRKEYAFEVLMGLGFGLVLTSLLTLIPLVVSKKDMPVVIGAVTQVRVLGGTIGLAISTTVLNSYVKMTLAKQLDEEQIEGISQSLEAIGKLDLEQQIFVRRTFAEGYARLMWIVAGFSGAVVLSALVMVERVPRRHAIGGGEEEREGT
jgi:hypothetical protein